MTILGEYIPFLFGYIWAGFILIRLHLQSDLVGVGLEFGGVDPVYLERVVGLLGIPRQGVDVGKEPSLGGGQKLDVTAGCFC